MWLPRHLPYNTEHCLKVCICADNICIYAYKQPCWLPNHASTMYASLKTVSSLGEQPSLTCCTPQLPESVILISHQWWFPVFATIPGISNLHQRPALVRSPSSVLQAAATSSDYQYLKIDKMAVILGQISALPSAAAAAIISTSHE